MSHFTGSWVIVESPDFDYDYMSMDVEPYVKLSQRGNNVTGEYYVGLQQGDIHGRLEGQQIAFTFEGIDEMDEVHGRGTIELKEGRLIFVLIYHYGDDYTFECERQ